MKKRGFTLVELLAVIAILALLVVIALPNIMGMFNRAKESTFVTEAKKIYRGAEQAYVRDAFNSSGTKIYSKCNGCTNPLDMSVRDDLEYYIEVNGQGKIVKYYIHDNSYQYSKEDPEGIAVNDISSVQKIADLDEEDRATIDANGPYIGNPPIKYKLVTDRGSFSTSGTVRSVYINALDDGYKYYSYKGTGQGSINNFSGSKLAIKVKLAKASCFTDSSYYRVYYTYQGHHDLLFELKKSDLPEHRYDLTKKRYLDTKLGEYTYLDAGFGYNGAAIKKEMSDDIRDCGLVDTSWHYYEDFAVDRSYEGPWVDSAVLQNYIDILNNSVSDYHVSSVSICDNCSENTLNIQWQEVKDIDVCYFSKSAGFTTPGEITHKICKNYQTLGECFQDNPNYNIDDVPFYDYESTECLTANGTVYCSGKSKFRRNVYFATGSFMSSQQGCYSHVSFVTCLSGDMEIEVYDKKKKKRVKKKLKDITYDDLVLSWDFDKGDYVWAEVLWIMKKEKANNYLLLTFSDGSTLKVIGDHRIFSCKDNSFVSCSKIKNGFTTVNSKGEIISLVKNEIVYEDVDVCNIITKDHINVFANGLLTSRGRNNIYQIENMKFVKEREGDTFKREDFPEISDEYYYGLRIGDSLRDYRGNEKLTRDNLVLLVERLEKSKVKRK